MGTLTGLSSQSLCECIVMFPYPVVRMHARFHLRPDTTLLATKDLAGQHCYLTGLSSLASTCFQVLAWSFCMQHRGQEADLFLTDNRLPHQHIKQHIQGQFNIDRNLESSLAAAASARAQLLAGHLGPSHPTAAPHQLCPQSAVPLPACQQQKQSRCRVVAPPSSSSGVACASRPNYHK